MSDFPYESCHAIRMFIYEYMKGHNISESDYIKLIECKPDEFERFMKYRGAKNGVQNPVYRPSLNLFVKERLMETNQERIEHSSAVGKSKIRTTKKHQKIKAEKNKEKETQDDEEENLRKQHQDAINERRRLQEEKRQEELRILHEEMEERKLAETHEKEEEELREAERIKLEIDEEKRRETERLKLETDEEERGQILDVLKALQGSQTTIMFIISNLWKMEQKVNILQI
jgi:hypothetical protein